MVAYTGYDMIYLLSASGLSPGGSCTIHIYTQTIHKMTQNKQYIEQQKIWEYKNFGIVRAVLRFGIRLTSDEKARENLRTSTMELVTPKTPSWFLLQILFKKHLKWATTFFLPYIGSLFDVMLTTLTVICFVNPVSLLSCPWTWHVRSASAGSYRDSCALRDAIKWTQ